jgi:NADH dehydrogenase [ubiquinone] 1 alpha subcomplex assembly factor 5
MLVLTRLPLQIGWKPSPNQPKPAKRGSGTTNLADVIGDEGATPLKPDGEK